MSQDQLVFFVELRKTKITLFAKVGEKKYKNVSILRAIGGWAKIRPDVSRSRQCLGGKTTKIHLHLSNFTGLTFNIDDYRATLHFHDRNKTVGTVFDLSVANLRSEPQMLVNLMGKSHHCYFIWGEKQQITTRPDIFSTNANETSDLHD